MDKSQENGYSFSELKYSSVNVYIGFCIQLTNNKKFPTYTNKHSRWYLVHWKHNMFKSETECTQKSAFTGGC